MTEASKQPINLKDYKIPPYRITHTALTFELNEDFCLVHAENRMEATGQGQLPPLRLNGLQLELIALNYEGRTLSPQDYAVDNESLTLQPDKAQFTLKVTTKIFPHLNTTLEGLYKSAGKFCTQCEAEGFRKITYFIDRPDNLTIFEVTIIADKKSYPVLLSNGNMIKSGDRADGKHFATWSDPFPKPSYLFALVAGNLISVDGVYQAKNGKNIKLSIFTEHENKNKCDFALAALKRAMKWDEDVYGLSYDLDIYMIVAVGDFNAGAMENKGLNIFNSKAVLANTKTSTDEDFARIDSIIAHEYFHNWTGNRVTLRDWFQLSLKEGLTVFRDQQFSADMTSPTVERIKEVKNLKDRQFSEDCSAVAHPVRPESYLEINNFYTPTVYDKGAELIRMTYEILGQANYYKGIADYIARYDGSAATIENFTTSLFADRQEDMNHFTRWYSQPGTPEVKLRGEYDSGKAQFTVHAEQNIPLTPTTRTRDPQLIPLKVALFDSQSNEQLALNLTTNTRGGPLETTLLLREQKQSFTFHGIARRPIPSYLRSFSAPIKLTSDLAQDDLLFLMKHDTDGYNRYETCQSLAASCIINLAQSASPATSAIDDKLMSAFGALLKTATKDALLLSNILALPSSKYLLTLKPGLDLDALFTARMHFNETLATKFGAEFAEIYRRSKSRGPYEFTQQAVGQRALQNTALWYLAKGNSTEIYALVKDQYSNADNMTDALGALQAIADLTHPLREELLTDFYQKWENDPLVVNKWFMLQSTANHPDNLNQIKALLNHPKFDIKNPNTVASVFSMATLNPHGLHHRSGEGYRLAADYIIKLNSINPSVASRLVNPFSQFKMFDRNRQSLMKEEIARIIKIPNLSKYVYEICEKTLQNT